MLLPILAVSLELVAVQGPSLSQQQRRTVAPKPVSPSDKVFLAAGFRVAGSRLEITYTVENKRDGEIYVLDVKDDPSPPYFLPRSPGAWYEPPATAVLACWWAYVPPDPTLTWVHPPMFDASPVAPGQKYTNKMYARLPLSPESGPADIGACTRARFEIAIVFGEPGAQRLESGGRSLVRLFRTSRAAQRVLRTEEYPVRIPMVGKE